MNLYVSLAHKTDAHTYGQSHMLNILKSAKLHLRLRCIFSAVVLLACASHQVEEIGVVSF